MKKFDEAIATCGIDNLLQHIIQPDDNIGEFGKIDAQQETPIENKCIIKDCDCGGLEIGTSNMAIKLSPEVYMAVKDYILNNNQETEENKEEAE